MDDDLLRAISADPQTSPFIGEGHRKIWAWLRSLNDMRVAKGRMRRLVREINLLFAHRVSLGKSCVARGLDTNPQAQFDVGHEWHLHRHR